MHICTALEIQNFRAYQIIKIPKVKPNFKHHVSHQIAMQCSAGVFSTSKLTMRKNYVPYCSLSSASRCGTVRQEIEAVYFLPQAPLRSTNHSEAVAT